jgi:hypothetical protein
MRKIARTTAIAVLLGLAACVSPNDVAKQIGGPPKAAVELRQLQTRQFSTKDEIHVLGAATQTLQDLGFSIGESATEAGVLVGFKHRDAEESGQVAGQVALTIVAALLGAAHTPTWDKEQKIQVTVVTSPSSNNEQVEVRVSFDRVLTNNHGVVWRAELLLDAPIYQEFFDKLSQAMFLEARKV